MSGLDKFLKTPGKSAKKIVAKDKKTKVGPKNPPKPVLNQESQESGEDIHPEESMLLPPEAEESEEITEFYASSPDSSEDQEDLEVHEKSPSPSSKYTKYQLKCTSKKCNYQRILMKPTLSSSDLICPKCGNQMRQK